MKVISTSNLIKMSLLSGLFIVYSVAAQEEVFTSLDTDSDGLISESEAQAHSALAGIFSQLDLNADGYLSLDEFSQANLSE